MWISAVLIALLAPTGAVPDPSSKAACEIGALILARPPDTGTPLEKEAVYDDEAKISTAGVPASNMFEACPSLRVGLHPDRRLATEADRKRSSGFGRPDPLTIFSISAPAFNARRSRASVATGYACPNLCAGVFLSRYRLVGRRWTLVAGPRLMLVS